jgi:transposase
MLSAGARRPAMDVKERERGDVGRLTLLIRAASHARQRDRYRIALWAIEGREKLDIARDLGVARSTVETWAYRYRDGGIAALAAKKPPGVPPTLPPERNAEFVARLTAGPRESDGVCTLRAKDARRILREEFGVSYSLPGVYPLLHRLGLSCLKPRPRHEKHDAEAQAKFKSETAPLLSAPSSRPSSR